jgi:uncharacterized SAM-binding protein YcdF (DUF218 family)
VTYTQPLLTVFFAIAAAALLVRGGRLRKALLIVAIGGLFLVSWPPADWLLSRPLEAHYPIRPFVAPAGLQALVVFSEGVEPPHFERPYPLASEATYRRCLYAAWIYGKYGPLPVLVSGGAAADGFPPLAAVMRDILVRRGVPASMIWTEERSESTHENALYSAVVLREHRVFRVALVVDATSMPRAAACLRKSGIEVVPAPSDFCQFGPLGEELLPSWKAVRQNEATLHEMIGLVWYRLRGWV